MKTTIFVSISLIIAGAAILGFEQFSYHTKEKVLEIGNVTASAEVTKTVRMPPLLGAALIGSGVVLLLFEGLRRKLR
ncbi:MAG: hypothetical protein RLZZ399_1498 [Verrucomicrobiota bacterium]|jgi:hypothetical protein